MSAASCSGLVCRARAMSPGGENMIAVMSGSVGSRPTRRSVRRASRSPPASTCRRPSPIAVVAIARRSSIWACSSGRAASGFRRTPPPGDSEIGRTPTASQSGPYSRLTSSTNALRPNSSIRHRSVLTRELLPWPSLPITIAFGSSRAPSPYKTQGSKQNAPPLTSRPMKAPRPPSPPAAVNG